MLIRFHYFDYIVYMSVCTLLTLFVPFAANLSANATFFAGPVDANHSTLVANPNTAYANNQNTVTIVATAADQYGNLIANGNIAFSLNSNASTYSQKSASNGQAQWSVASANVETDSVKAVFDNNVTISTNIAFVAGPVSTTTSTLVVSSTNEPANNTNIITGTLTVRDSLSRVMNNQNVAFSASGSQTTVVTVTNPTNSSGVANANFTSNLAQNENVQAVVNGVTFIAPIAFSGNMNSLAINAATGGFTGTISSPNVIAYDSGGRISVGYTGTVAFSSSDPLATVPGNYQFTSSDRGVHSFASQATLVTNGVQTLTVTDTASSIAAQQPNLVVYAGYNYTLSPNNVRSLCVELADGNAIVGNRISTNICSSALRQNIHENSNNNLIVQGLCVAPSGILAGASIVVNTCDNSNQQKWIRTSSYQYQSVSNTSYCLDANLAQANTGMSLQLCDSLSQTQKLIATPSPTMLRIGLVNSTYCLDDKSGSSAQGTVVQSYACNHSTPQRFGTDQNQTITFFGRCVEFPGSPPVSGVLGVLNACTGATTQKYIFNGNNILLAANPNLCIDFQTQSNHQIQATTCNGDANQNIMVTISGMYNYWMSVWNPGNYLMYDSTVSSKLSIGGNLTNAFSLTQISAQRPHIWFLDNTHYLNNTSGTSLTTTTYLNYLNQLFWLPGQDANGYYYLNNNGCVDANTNPVALGVCADASPSFNFARIHAAIGLALTSNPNLCLNYANGSFLSTTPLEMNTCDKQSMSQKISFMMDNSIRFAGLCATPKSGVQAGSVIQQAPCLEGLPSTQQWTFGNSNTIRSVADPNYCWTATTSAAGSSIQLQTCSNSALQLLTMQ